MIVDAENVLWRRRFKSQQLKIDKAVNDDACTYVSDAYTHILDAYTHILDAHTYNSHK